MDLSREDTSFGVGKKKKIPGVPPHSCGFHSLPQASHGLCKTC